jgi:hypothetical protein
VPGINGKNSTMKNIFLAGLVFVFSCNNPGKENKSVADKNAIDSILHDTAFEYYDNGRLKAIVPLTNGLRNGASKVFDSAGNFVYTDYYYYDLAVGPTAYYGSGGDLRGYFFVNLQRELLLKIDYSSWKGIEDVVGRSIRFTTDTINDKPADQVTLLLYLMDPPKISFSYSIYKKKVGVDTGYTEVQKFERGLPFVQAYFPLLPEDEHYVIGLRIHDSILNRKAIVYKEL